jgi:hypothetical protein
MLVLLRDDANHSLVVVPTFLGVATVIPLFPDGFNKPAAATTVVDVMAAAVVPPVEVAVAEVGIIVVGEDTEV